MISNLRKEQELVTCNFCTKVAHIDAPTVSTDSKKYVESNALNYYLIINTWLMMVRQYAGVAYHELWENIGNFGLLSTIKTLVDDAQKLVSGSSDISGLGTQIIRGVEAPPLKRWAVPEVLLDSTDIGRSKLATVLQLMRYARKFSPANADKISSESISDFLFVERENKRFSQREYSRFGCSDSRDSGIGNGGGLNRVILDFVRDSIESLYDWDEICSEIDKLSYADFELPPGTTRAGSKTTAQKLDELFNQSEESFEPIFGVRPLRLRAPIEYTPGPSKVQAVPKSYKAARIIAMEDCTLNAHSRAISRIFREIDNHRVINGRRGRCPINLEHQEWNQEAAKQSASASASICYATIDASHASDYITQRLAQEVLPDRYLRRVDKLIPRYFEVEGKVYPKWMHSTSGHQLTFLHETIIYYGICAASMDYYNLLFGEENNTLPLTVYGDDVCIDSRYAPIAIEFMEKCGLHINHDKTFIEGPYRESCGKEYYNREDVTSLYYPRFPIRGSITEKNGITGFSRTPNRDSYTGDANDSLQMLIALEKKFADWCYEACQFLKAVVLEIKPEMTCSEFGANSADLWDYAEKGPLSPCPALFSVDLYSDIFMHMHKKLKKIGVKEGREFQSIQHLVPYVNYAGIKGRDGDTDLLIRWYQYQDFLKRGPQYASPLDKLLGISSPPPKIGTFYTNGVVDWKLVK